MYILDIRNHALASPIMTMAIYIKRIFHKFEILYGMDWIFNLCKMRFKSIAIVVKGQA
jgi:hypothetical protein